MASSSTLAAERPARSTPVRAGASGLHRREWLWAVFFLGPNLLLFFSFTLVPMLFGLSVSFFDWNMIDPARFVGIGNYVQFFVGDQLSAKVVGNSLYFVLGALPASVLVPLGLAVLLNVGRQAVPQHLLSAPGRIGSRRFDDLQVGVRQGLRRP